MTSYEFEVAAKNAVIDAVEKEYGEKYGISDINVVWFAHVLGRKKCILCDNGENYRLYEVTYNPDDDALYVDIYNKQKNLCIKGDL